MVLGFVDAAVARGVPEIHFVCEPTGVHHCEKSGRNDTDLKLTSQSCTNENVYLTFLLIETGRDGMLSSILWELG